MHSETAVLRRPRLLSELDRALSVRLVLVTAPAGYGKSVLVRDWTERRSEVDTAWVDLDHRDNDPMRFWRRTFETIDAATTLPLDQLARELGAGRPGEILRALEFMNDSLADMDRRLVLIFDDFHLIRSPDVLESFEFFRDTAPDNMGVVLVARRDPPLGVARMRVLDELVEIREKDLRFTEAEIADLADAAGLNLDAAAVTRLHGLTDGWAAALRLALISVGSSGDPSLVLREVRQDNPDIARFFAEEVIGEIPDATREFLLATSLLDQVNAANAAALSGAENAQALLEDLAARSLLTTRVAGSGQWFRYHRLFRRLLRAELRRSRTEVEIQELHRRAAAWYREHQDVESAIPHAIAAGDQEAATDWLAELSPHLMETGRAATLLDLSDQIIDSVEEPTISQLVCRGEALHGLGLQPDEFDRILNHIEQQLGVTEETVQTTDLATRSADPRSWESPSTLPWLRAVRCRLRGDAQGLVELLRTDAIPSPSAVVEAEVAEALIWLERYSEAEQMLEVPMINPGYLVQTVHHLGLLATIRAGCGRFAEAQVLVDRALVLCADHQLGQMRHTMYARLIGARLEWGRGELEAAESNAVDVQIFAEQFADVPLAAQHALMRSGVRWSLGDGVGARALLDRAAVTITGRPVTGHFADRLLFARAKLDLLEGDPGGAQVHLPDWRERLELGPTTMRDWLLLMRLASAADGPQTAVDERPPPELDAGPLHLAEWHRIRAHALDLSGSRANAEKELAKSFETVDHLSLIQPLIDERHILGSLLPAAVRRAGLDLPGLGEREDAPVPRPVYVEPLTEREQIVLGYMATHLSYPEIAAELYVSNNTVKSHCRSIFRKLAVHSRADAVTRARAYGLLND